MRTKMASTNIRVRDLRGDRRELYTHSKTTENNDDDDHNNNNNNDIIGMVGILCICHFFTSCSQQSRV